MVAEVWASRRTAREIAAREFRSRYASSSLGVVWAVVEPLVQFLLYYALFGMVLGTRLESAGGRGEFGLYLFVGLVPFLALQESVVRTVALGRTHAQLLRQVQVPGSVLVSGTVAAVLARYALFLVVAVGAAASAGTIVIARLPWLLVGVALLVAMCVGFGLLLLPAGAYLPDLAQAAPTVMTILFFMTPVVYPMSVVPTRLHGVFAAHPLLGLVEVFRHALIGGGVTPSRLLAAAALAVASLGGGAWFYRRRAASLPDVV